MSVPFQKPEAPEPFVANWSTRSGPLERRIPYGDFPPSGHACAYCPGVSKQVCCQHEPKVVYLGNISSGTSTRECGRLSRRLLFGAALRRRLSRLFRRSPR